MRPKLEQPEEREETSRSKRRQNREAVLTREERAANGRGSAATWAGPRPTGAGTMLRSHLASCLIGEY